MVERRGSQARDAGRHGELHVDYRSPTHLRTRLVGHFDVRLADRLVAAVEHWAGERASLTAFHDCALLEDYDVDARERVTAWSRPRLARFDAVHLLVQSRVVAWGLSVIALALGPRLVAHHQRATFEAAVARARAPSPASRR